MAAGRMHVDEADIDAALVRRLVDAQFPGWADLPLEPVRSAGTDNAIFRLGGELAVRLPRTAAASGQVAKEQAWLRQLAPLLPLPIPVQVAMGMPGEAYPWRWSVCRWLPGENAVAAPVRDLDHAASVLADFIAALQAVDAAGGPAPGRHNSGRGVPLAERDSMVRSAIAKLEGLVDVAAVTQEWEAALAARAWTRPGVWLHGDIHPGNLLTVDGRISAVIDFGCLGVGDPACEMIAAWMVLSGPSRRIFRRALALDDATWARRRGWALSMAVVALPYYLHTNPVLVGLARRAIAELLAESGA
ncbi:aminoglycoside phosphotransferase family protein [soil metagenome]